VTHLLDLANGGPRRSRAEHVRSVLWLGSAAWLAVCLGALALLYLDRVNGDPLIFCGAVGALGFVAALALEWKLGRDPGGDDDDGDDTPEPDRPGPGMDPVKWGPYDRILRDLPDGGDREPVLG
jgi:hypothetical protein